MIHYRSLGNIIIQLLFREKSFQKIMRTDEKRSHRLNYLLKYYLLNPQESVLYQKAKQMGVSDSTAKDYIRTVIIQAAKISSR